MEDVEDRFKAFRKAPKPTNIANHLEPSKSPARKENKNNYYTTTRQNHPKISANTLFKKNSTPESITHPNSLKTSKNQATNHPKKNSARAHRSRLLWFAALLASKWLGNFRFGCPRETEESVGFPHFSYYSLPTHRTH